VQDNQRIKGHLDLRPRETPELLDEELEDRLVDLRRLRSCFLDPEEPESESDPELDPELSELESESESELEDADGFLVRFLDDPSSMSFVSCSLAFSFASNILLAVPLFVKNSSGTSTEGFPSDFSFPSTRGFSSCCVRDGRVIYGRVDLHS